MNEEYTPDLLTVSDDDGVEHVFEILDRIEIDETKYVAVTPYFEDPEEMLEAECELIVLKADEIDGESYLVAIEDDDEFDEIASIFEERLNEMYEIDDENLN